MTYERVRELARGRVWTGADAPERGLVDELGGLHRAAELARERATCPRTRAAALAADQPARNGSRRRGPARTGPPGT